MQLMIDQQRLFLVYLANAVHLPAPPLEPQRIIR
jgi:hypothetical protein